MVNSQICFKEFRLKETAIPFVSDGRCGQNTSSHGYFSQSCRVAPVWAHLTFTRACVWLKRFTGVAMSLCTLKRVIPSHIMFHRTLLGVPDTFSSFCSSLRWKEDSLAVWQNHFFTQCAKEEMPMGGWAIIGTATGDHVSRGTAMTRVCLVDLLSLSDLLELFISNGGSLSATEHWAWLIRFTWPFWEGRTAWQRLKVNSAKGAWLVTRRRNLVAEATRRWSAWEVDVHLGGWRVLGHQRHHGRSHRGDS